MEGKKRFLCVDTAQTISMAKLPVLNSTSSSQFVFLQDAFLTQPLLRTTFPTTETTKLIRSSLGQCPVGCQKALGVCPFLRPWPFVGDPSPSVHRSRVLSSLPANSFHNSTSIAHFCSKQLITVNTHTQMLFTKTSIGGKTCTYFAISSVVLNCRLGRVHAGK